MERKLVAVHPSRKMQIGDIVVYAPWVNQLNPHNYTVETEEYIDESGELVQKFRSNISFKLHTFTPSQFYDGKWLYLKGGGPTPKRKSGFAEFQRKIEGRL